MKKGGALLVGLIALTTLIMVRSFARKNVQNASLNQKPSETENTTEILYDPAPLPVDWRAAFAIYTNGTFREFTAAMYHNQSADAYIESDNPNIVNIKKSGLTWGDFFSTIPLQLSEDCLTTGTGQTFCSNQTHSLKFYIDGARTHDFLESEMKDGQRVLITYGQLYDPAIADQLRSVPIPPASPQ